MVLEVVLPLLLQHALSVGALPGRRLGTVVGSLEVWRQVSVALSREHCAFVVVLRRERISKGCVQGHLQRHRGHCL